MGTRWFGGREPKAKLGPLPSAPCCTPTHTHTTYRPAHRRVPHNTNNTAGQRATRSGTQSAARRDNPPCLLPRHDWQPAAQTHTPRCSSSKGKAWLRRGSGVAADSGATRRRPRGLCFVSSCRPLRPRSRGQQSQSQSRRRRRGGAWLLPPTTWPLAALPPSSSATWAGPARRWRRMRSRCPTAQRLWRRSWGAVSSRLVAAAPFIRSSRDCSRPTHWRPFGAAQLGRGARPGPLRVVQPGLVGACLRRPGCLVLVARAGGAEEGRIPSARFQK